ncbi:hypothetical protein NG895_08470 [Aeoliella sp. ICT_H6.2]|uniref:YXWGXW repeat-containing protein n=1 Tax=Aeoliella straminimaris TaxID=2954799 RepID=A0A9X2FCU3_9BACT|nr:hypothetical protein [Aeoliella straminimaris]MCO6043939.1 hypothetical protein [Aeoliella straminimaris]
MKRLLTLACLVALSNTAALAVAPQRVATPQHNITLPGTVFSKRPASPQRAVAPQRSATPQSVQPANYAGPLAYPSDPTYRPTCTPQPYRWGWFGAEYFTPGPEIHRTYTDGWTEWHYRW